MSENPAAVPLQKLANGAEIPMIGLGTWTMDDTEAGAAVRSAIDVGYRLFDTAENYGNEVGIGEGIARSPLARNEVFLTSKFNAEWHSFDGVRQAWRHSIEQLGVDYIDLLLIHWPNPERGTYVDAYKGLAKLLAKGKVRAIGTSNFTQSQLTELMDATGVVPDVNQIQHSPLWMRADDIAFHQRHGIHTQAWAPLARGGVLEAAPVVEAATAHQKTPAQVVLRWNLQHGASPIPKSEDPGRMASNLDVFGFELDAAQMSAIDALDGTGDAPVDPMVFGH
ncbi:aldo/keto reductase [Arthrobacter rhombi]|uniref:aldo/keto reductase n=1 Tax=Arthrobacter rhombi TaxID=71253 RepID=UPI002652A2DF|nr:aldo/keto reductase [Micrococcaceae bacterium]